MIRIQGKLQKTSWQKALKFVYENIKDLAPEEIFFSASGKITNEDNYVIQKFARAVFKTNNVDSCCSRLCHAATVQAMNDCFGTSNLTVMDNVKKIDCLFVIGSNPASNYPVFFDKLLEEKKKRGIKIISAQSLLNLTACEGDVCLEIAPGTEVVLLNGLINSLILENAFSKEAKGIEGFESLKRKVKEFTPEFVCKTCGIQRKTFDAALKTIRESKAFAVFHGMGFTQHVNATENVHSLINLMLLKKGIPLTLRGEINVQGVGDIGSAPDALPSGSFASLPLLEKKWHAKLANEKGKNILEALLIDPVKAAFISGFNPAQSMPNLVQVHKHLEKMFLVQMDSFENITTKFADVVLPVPLLIERNGTICNGERRLRKASKVIEPLGESMPEWLVYKELARLFGKEKFLAYKNEKDILEEIIEVVPDFKGVNAGQVWKGDDAWPDKTIKFKKFWPERFEGVDDIRSKKYPLLLTTVRKKFSFLTGEMSSESKTLVKLEEKNGFYFSKADARKLGLKDNDLIEVESSISSLKGPAFITKNLPKGIIASSIHSDKLLVNKLFPTRFDEESFTPNYKAVAVNVKKV